MAAVVVPSVKLQQTDEELAQGSSRLKAQPSSTGGDLATSQSQSVLMRNAELQRSVRGLAMFASRRSAPGASLSDEAAAFLSYFADALDQSKTADELAEFYRTLLGSQQPDTEQQKQAKTQRQFDEAPFLRRKDGRPKHHWINPVGFLERCRDSRLGDIFYSDVWESEVTLDELDSIVSVLMTVAALIVAVPFSLLTSVNTSGWSTLQATLQSCSAAALERNLGISSDDPGAITSFINAKYNTLSRLLLSGILIPIMSIACAVWWFVTRPTIAQGLDGADGKSMPLGRDPRFRLWWRRGRWLFIIVLVLTTAALIVDIFATAVYYLLFFGNPTTFCDQYATRQSDLTVSWAIVISLIGGLLYVFI